MDPDATPLGKKVGHGPAGYTLLDWDQLPPRKGAQQPPLSRFTDEACVRVKHGPCLITARAMLALQALY